MNQLGFIFSKMEQVSCNQSSHQGYQVAVQRCLNEVMNWHSHLNQIVNKAWNNATGVTREVKVSAINYVRYPGSIYILAENVEMEEILWSNVKQTAARYDEVVKEVKIQQGSCNVLQTGFSYAPVIKSPSESKTSSCDAFGSKQLPCFPTKELYWLN